MDLLLPIAKSDFKNVYSKYSIDQEWITKDNPITRAMKKIGNISFLACNHELWVFIGRRVFAYKIPEFEEQIERIATSCRRAEPPVPLYLKFLYTREVDQT